MRSMSFADGQWAGYPWAQCSLSQCTRHTHIKRGVKERRQAISAVPKVRAETSTGPAVTRKSNVSSLFRRKSSSSDSDTILTANWKLPPIASRPLKLQGIDGPRKRHQKGSVSWDSNIVEKEGEQPIVIATASAVSICTQEMSIPEDMELGVPSSPPRAIEAPNVLTSTVEIHEEEGA